MVWHSSLVFSAPFMNGSVSVLLTVPESVFVIMTVSCVLLKNGVNSEKYVGWFHHCANVTMYYANVGGFRVWNT